MFPDLSTRNARRVRAQTVLRGVLKTTSLVSASLVVAGCMAHSPNAALISTGAIDGSGAPSATIDPTYNLAPEVDDSPRANASVSDPMLEYFRRAAQVAMEDGQIFGAVGHLSQLYEQTPNDVDVIYNLARHLRYVDLLGQAETVLNNGLAIDPNHALLRLERAKVLIAGGEAEEAVTILEQLRREHPRDPSVLQSLGVALDRRGDHAEAQEIYHAAISVARPSAPLLNNLAMSLALGGDLIGAKDKLEQAMVAPGSGPQISQNLALVLSLKGDEAGARKLAERVAPREIAEAALDAYSNIAAPAHPWLRVADE